MVAMDGMGQVEQRLVVSFAEVKNKTKKKEYSVAPTPGIQLLLTLAFGLEK